MERIFDLLETAGYPVEAIDWLRQHALITICALAVAAWALFIALGWAFWTLLT